MSPHFVSVCTCGRVIAQCRCIGPKTTTVVKDGCPSCRASLPATRAGEACGVSTEVEGHLVTCNEPAGHVQAHAAPLSNGSFQWSERSLRR